MELTDQIVACMKTGRVDTEYQARINSLDFHRSADLLVTAADDDSIKIYGLETGCPHQLLHSKKYGIANVNFTHHPSSIVFSSNKGPDHALRYLSIHENNFVRYFRGHTDRVVSVGICPKSDLIMSTSQDKTMMLWDLRVQNCQGHLQVPSGIPTAAFDQQGLIFCVGLESGLIKLYDIRCFDQGPFATFLVPEEVNSPASFSSLKFSPDGKILVGVVGSKIYQLDAYSGSVKQKHSSGIQEGMRPLQACFSPDNNYLLSGQADKSIKIWSTATGNEVACWQSQVSQGQGHLHPPTCVAWAPRRLLVASACHLLNLWIPAVADLKLMGLVN